MAPADRINPADRVKYAAFLPPRVMPFAAGQRPPSRPQLSLNALRPRDLGLYAITMLDLIGDEYSINAGEWRSAFADVLAAYALAISQMDITLKDAERETEREAAWAAFIVSVLTAGSMRFLGAYVQYSVLPKAFPGKLQQLSFFTSSGSLSRTVTVGEISKQYAAAFGGITQDLGNKLIPKLMEASTATGPHLHTIGGLEVMRSSFTKLLDSGTGMVLTQLSDAKAWILNHEEFGSEWIAHSGGSAEAAKNAIRDRLNRNRIEWGKTWPIYGRKPIPIVQQQLANHYERGLWIGYIGPILYASKPIPRPRVLIDIEKWLNPNAVPAYRRNPRNYPLLQGAIFRRLKELNVVRGETLGELVKQAESKVQSQAPVPEVEVSDEELTTFEEFDSIKAWVDNALPRLKEQSEKQFFPESRLRVFAPR